MLSSRFNPSLGASGGLDSFFDSFLSNAPSILVESVRRIGWVSVGFFSSALGFGYSFLTDPSRLTDSLLLSFLIGGTSTPTLTAW